MPPIRTWPVFARLAYFLAAIALLVAVLRVAFAVFNGEPLNVWSWADARYFVAMWAIFSAAYYLGWAIWRFALKR